MVTGSEIDNYSLDCTITNETTGEYIEVEVEMEIDQVLIIDTETELVQFDDGTTLATAVTLSSDRRDWLHLERGINVISFTETGVVEIDVDIEWNRRYAE